MDFSSHVCHRKSKTADVLIQVEAATSEVPLCTAAVADKHLIHS